MGNRPAVVTATLLGALVLVGLAAPDPQPHEMEPNEQREWALEEIADWSDYSRSATAQFTQDILDGAEQACLRAELSEQKEPDWATLQQAALGANYVAYSVECPLMLEQYEAWLDDTNNWP